MEFSVTRVMLRLRQRGLLRYFGALAARATEVIGKFGLYLLAAREMGASDSGLFFLCLNWVNLASSAARMGLERAVSRHVAAELAVGDFAAAKQAITVGVGWIAIASLGAGAMTFLVAGPASSLLFRKPELIGPLRVAAFVLPPQSIAFALGFALIGLGRGVAGQLVQSALPPLLSLLALLAGMNRAGPLLYGYSLSYGLCCLLGFGLIAKDWRTRVSLATRLHLERIEKLPSLRTTAQPFLVIELVQAALLSVPVLILGAFATAAAVSAFSIASRLVMMINTILVSLAMISAPAFARHHRLREYGELRRAERQTRLLGIAVCLPMAAIIMIFPRTLLSLLGDGFESARLALTVLTIGQLVNIWLPTQDMMLAMTGNGRALLRVNVYQMAICSALSLLLIPAFGLLGAALVSSICLVHGRIGFTLAVRRLLPQLSTKSQPLAV